MSYNCPLSLVRILTLIIKLNKIKLLKLDK
nr:MAG TPA: hypothetical protein [Bacteriophage sp.]